MEKETISNQIGWNNNLQGIKLEIPKTVREKHHKKDRNSSSSSSSSSSLSDHKLKLAKKDKSREKEERRRLKSEKRKLKKKLKVEYKLSKKEHKKYKKLGRTRSSSKSEDDLSVPVNLMNTSAKAPETKEQFEARQNEIRRYKDPDTGRTRLIKGDGEILEEIVSRDRHKKINKRATENDGDYFQKNLIGWSIAGPSNKK